jgi:hypothetical protein
VAGDDHDLREALQRAADPPTTTGVFDEVSRRRGRYRLRRRVSRATLAVVVIAGAGAATWTLARSFGLGTSQVATPPPATAPATGEAQTATPPTAPATTAPVEPTPATTATTGPQPTVEADCRQTSRVEGDFDGDGEPESARLQLCGDVWFLSVEHPGRTGPVPRWELRQCELGCRILAAPDIDVDGTDELAIVTLGFSIEEVILFDASEDVEGPVAITVASPGDPAGQFDPGRPGRFGFGGDAFSTYNVRCEAREGGQVMVATAAESLPHDRVDALWHVHQTVLRFARADGELLLVAVDEYTLPTNGPEEHRLFADHDHFCGAPTVP